MGINQKTNQFLTKLTDLVKNCGLPACNARMALDLVRNQVAQLEAQAMEQERQAEQNRKKPAEAEKQEG